MKFKNFLKFIINNGQKIIDYILVFFLKHPFFKSQRRVFLISAINKNLYFDKNKQLYYTRLKVPDSHSNNIKCYLHPQDVRSDWIHNRLKVEVRQDYLIKLSRKIIKFSKVRCLVDIGANYGEYFASSYKLCRYIGFEPNPFVFKMLSETVGKNNCHEKAICTNNFKGKKINLLINPFYSGGTTIERYLVKQRNILGLDIGFHKDLTYTHPSECITVREILKNENLESIKLFIKIDIEGMDSSITKELLNSKAKNKIFIQLEINKEHYIFFKDNFKKLINRDNLNEFVFIPLLNKLNTNLLIKLANSKSKSNLHYLLKQNSIPLKRIIDYFDNYSRNLDYGEIIIFNKNIL